MPQIPKSDDDLYAPILQNAKGVVAGVPRYEQRRKSMMVRKEPMQKEEENEGPKKGLNNNRSLPARITGLFL